MLPDALAYQGAAPGGAIAVTGGGARALAAPASLSSWSPLVSAAGLRRVSPGCGVTTLDAVAILPTGGAAGRHGLPRRPGRRLHADRRIVATERVHARRVAARIDHRRAPPRRHRVDHDGARLGEPGRAPSAGGALADRRCAMDGIAAARRDPGDVGPLDCGELQRCVRRAHWARRGRRAAVEIAAGGLWTPLPGAPVTDDGPCAAAGPATIDSVPVDAFTVDGGSLGVFALSPSGTRWVRVQSSQVPLAYGSSG